MKIMTSPLFFFATTFTMSVAAQDTDAEFPLIHDCGSVKWVKTITFRLPADIGRKNGYWSTIIYFSLDGEGGVVDVSAADGAGTREFNRSAIRAVKTWRYDPTASYPVQKCTIVFNIHKVDRTATIDYIWQPSEGEPLDTKGAQ